MRFISLRSPVKPCLVKYFKWLLKVMKKGKGLAKANLVFRPDHGRLIRIPKGTVGALRRGLQGEHWSLYHDFPFTNKWSKIEATYSD